VRTSWPAACQSLPTVEPTRPAPRTAIFISLLPPSEAVSCRDDELAVGAVLFHVGVRLRDLVETVHTADGDGGRAGGDGVQEVLQDPRREVGGVPFVRGQPHPRGAGSPAGRSPARSTGSDGVWVMSPTQVPRLRSSGLRVVAASPRHIFAMKALAARTRDIDDLRLLAGVVGVESADAALQICAKRSS
jgi:hypothetical protein